MKRFLTLAFIVFAILYALSACGCDDGREIDLVFVNGSDITTIASVQVDSEYRGESVQNADSSPLRRSDSFGFEVESYPVIVVAYGEPSGQKELARVTVSEPPLNGERWYVTARDGADGLSLAVDVRWPDGI